MTLGPEGQVQPEALKITFPVYSLLIRSHEPKRYRALGFRTLRLADKSCHGLGFRGHGAKKMRCGRSANMSDA